MVSVGNGSSNMLAVFEKTPTGGRFGGPEPASSSGSGSDGVTDSVSGTVAGAGTGACTGAATDAGTATGTDGDPDFRPTDGLGLAQWQQQRRLE